MQWKYEKGRIHSEDENGTLVSEVTFNEKNTGVVNINHVYVAPKLRGAGVASNTMEVMAKYLKDENLKTTATCSYANTWLKRNKAKYSDIILDELYNEPMACSIKGKH